MKLKLQLIIESDSGETEVVREVTKLERHSFRPENLGPNPSFSTGGVRDPGSRSGTTSWSKGLPHKSDVLALTQKLSARADARWRLGWQGEVQLSEQESVIGFRMGVAA